MNVYFDKRLIVVETNLAWARPYWRKRRQQDDRITWTLR